VFTRLVELDDAEALRSIYNPEVLETTVTFDLVARSLEDQQDWIRDHLGVHSCLVAVNDDDDIGFSGARNEKILGFAALNPFRNRPAYFTTVENSVYVHRDARGRRVGERLLRDLITLAGASGFHSLIARIVGANESSIALHERCGFSLVGREREVGRKHGRWLDVVEYQYVIPDEGN
jgi:phosphinothricin acetyltransferase